MHVTIPDVVTSSDDTLKFDITSCSMTAMSASFKELVTLLETSNVATSPVIEGAAVGTLEVGAGIGCTVGRDVTNEAQHKFINI
jgi:hypothetical protein